MNECMVEYEIKTRRGRTDYFPVSKVERSGCSMMPKCEESEML